MAGPAAGEARGGGVATVEASAGASGGPRGAAVVGSRGGSSPLGNARGTSWSPSSRTLPLAAGRGRGVVLTAKGPGLADDRINASGSSGADPVTEVKQAAPTIGSASAPAAGAPAACVAVDGGPCLRGKYAGGSPTSRRPPLGNDDEALVSSRVAAIAQQLEWAAASHPAPETVSATPGTQQQIPTRGAPSPGPAEVETQEDFSVEVQECFHKMYSGAYSVDLVVSLLQRLSQAPVGDRDSGLFLAMLETLFCEYQYFPRYPTQQLLLTAELFGKLIASQVLLPQPTGGNSVAAANPSSLVIALRCVLEALRRGPNSKMFLFGVAALEQILARLYRFPDFVVCLSRLPPHFNLQCPHYTAYIESLLLLIPKRFHKRIYLDLATAADLPAIPEPPATRGPGATNLTPTIVSAAASAPPGIMTSGTVGTSQQQAAARPHSQQNLSHSPAVNVTNTTTTAHGCIQNTKASPNAVLTAKAGEGGRGDRPSVAGGLEQQRRQQPQTGGLAQQQQIEGKGLRQNNGAVSTEVGVGVVGLDMMGNSGGTGVSNPGDAAGGGGMVLFGGANTRPYFAVGGAQGMNAGGLCLAAGEQSLGNVAATAVTSIGPGGQQIQQSDQGNVVAGGSGAATTAPSGGGLQQQQQVQTSGDPNTLVLGGGRGLTSPPPAAIGALLQGVGLGQVEGLMNDRELLSKLVLPPQWLAEQVIAACNSVCEANVDDKAAALRQVLAPEYQAWLAFYLVKSRASKEPNLHAIFFLFIEKLEMPGLPEVVVSMSYDCINTLLKYLVEAKESSSYRTLLKNLGLWLGRITLGRNRPLMSKRLDLKTLLFRGYDEGHLVAVLPLVCKVLEGVKLSKVFKPPNPWTTAMLSLLAELQQLPNLRTNLIFEVEVLFKHLHLNVQDYHGRSRNLARRAVPAASPDFVVRTAVPALDSTGAIAAAPATGGPPPPTVTAGLAAAPSSAAGTVKPLPGALNIPGATAASLLTAGPPPGIATPTATLETAAAAAVQQQATAAAVGAGGPPPGSALRAAASIHACATTPTAARDPGASTPERATGVGSAGAGVTATGAGVPATEGGITTGAVCSRLLLAAAAGNAAAAQKLQQQQQQQQRGTPNAVGGGGQLESHQAAGEGGRLAMDTVIPGLRTAAAAGGGAGPSAAGPLQQHLLAQQQQVLAQRQQQLSQLQSQSTAGTGGATANAVSVATVAAAAASQRGGAPPRSAEETLLQHHQRLLAAAAASAAVNNGSTTDGVPTTTADDAETLTAVGARRDPRSLLLAAALRGSAAGETSSLFLPRGGGAAGTGIYPHQATAVEQRAAFATTTTYTADPQGSVAQTWTPLQEEQQGTASAATGLGGNGSNASLLTLLQQQQGGSAGGGGTAGPLLEQQAQVAAGGGTGAAAAAAAGGGGGPPSSPTQKSGAAAATVQPQQATAAGTTYRSGGASGVAAGSSSAGIMDPTAVGGGAGGASPPSSLFGVSSAAAEAFAAGAGTSSLMPSDSLLQNLAQNVVISPSIALLSLQPGLRPLVPLAVERAVREIISAVAERSVTISCVTTRELVCKDFCMEGEECLIKRAAHLMVASLAGSLALITCREPLRVSLTQNLRQLLQPVASTPECGDQVLVEQVLQIVSTDNLDLGCSVIEQAVVEKVLRDIEISIQPALLLRRQAKERGVPFVDTQYVNNGRWPMALPEPLKLHPLLNTRQLQVYKDFMLVGPLRKMHQQHLYGTQQQQQLQQQQQRTGGSQQQQQQVMGGAGQQQQPHGGSASGVATGGGGGPGVAAAAPPSAAGSSLASSSGRDSGESTALFNTATGGGTLISGGATTGPSRMPPTSQQQQREATTIQQMAATVAAARALNQQQQQKLLQLQQQGASAGLTSAEVVDGLSSTKTHPATAAAAGGGIGPPVSGGSSPQQQQRQQQQQHKQQGRTLLNAQQSIGVGTTAPATGGGVNLLPYHPQSSHYPGQEPSLSVLLLRLEACLVQLRDVVRDIFNSPPVMPTPSTSHRFSYPAGCQMHALPVPRCSTAALLVFACLPSNHELFQLIAAVSSIASSCSRMDEVAHTLAQKLIKSVFEGAALAAQRRLSGSALRGVDPTGLYMEVFFAVLAALRRESEVVGKLAGEVLSLSCASASLPPKRSYVAVAAGLIRYGLMDFPTSDGILTNHLEEGRNAAVVEFVLVLLKVLQDQRAVSRADLPNTFKTLAAAEGLPSRMVQLRGWQCLSLAEARDKLLENFQQEDNATEPKETLPFLTTLTQLMDEYCVPAYPVKVRCLSVLPEISLEIQQLVRRIFEDWIRLCAVPTTSSSVRGSAAGGGAGTAGSGSSWVSPQQQQQQSAAHAANVFCQRKMAGTPETGGAAGECGDGGMTGATGGGLQQSSGSSPLWVGEENALLLRAVFFQRVSQQGLLRMDEDTDRFFAVCVEVAVEKASILLRIQAARNSSTSKQRMAAAAATGVTAGATLTNTRTATASKDPSSLSAAAEIVEGGPTADRGAGSGEACTNYNEAPEPQSKDRNNSNSSSNSTTGERTPQQQHQQKKPQDQQSCDDRSGRPVATTTPTVAGGGSGDAAVNEKIAPGELNSVTTNEGQGTDVSSGSNSSSGGPSQKPSAGQRTATAAQEVLQSNKTTKESDEGGAANSTSQVKGGGVRDQQETNNQQEQETSRKETSGTVAATGRTNNEAEQQQQKQYAAFGDASGVLAVDPAMSAQALAAMETPADEAEAPIDTVPLDSLAKMIAAMMRFVDPQQVSPVLILQRALGVICRYMHMQAETLGSNFNQRPYFRLLLSILLEVTSASAFPLIASSGTATTTGSTGINTSSGAGANNPSSASGAAAAATGAGSASQQSSTGSSSSSNDGGNSSANARTGSPKGGSSYVSDAAAAAVAQQQLLLQQSVLSFADHLALLSPMRLPAFAFAWIELVGHRAFLPLLLRGPNQLRGSPRSGWVALHKLLLLHFEFIHPFLASVSLSDSVRQLYKGTLRVLLVLLHDFPEYLCETYVDCCSVLPLNCVQLRNVILSAFPRNMRLPDPFLPNLRVDLLPEVRVVPRLLLTHSFYSVLLLHQRQKQQLLKTDVDLYWQTRDPALLPRIRKKLLLPNKAEALRRGTKYDVPLVNAFLLYVATSVPDHDPRTCGTLSGAIFPPGPLPPTVDGTHSSNSSSNNSSNGSGSANDKMTTANNASAGGYGDHSNGTVGCGYCNSSLYRVHPGGDITHTTNDHLSPDGGGNLQSPALEIILYLAKELDMEGRYLLMSAIANHLRYPNAHTHFFSNLLLWLFSESKEELVQEQITRVLLERLIVHRPHPWGLLITFIELIKNPRFAFWSCLFVSAAPEVEKLFQSVAHTCLGQSGAQQLQQQRQR